MSLIPRIYQILRRFNFEIHTKVTDNFPIEISEIDRSALIKAMPYTMTPAQRFSAISLCMRYLRENQIEGAVVECGVWAGGSIGAAALIGVQDKIKRKYWLFDTFEGMTRPSNFDGISPQKIWNRSRHLNDLGSDWCEVNQLDVENNLKLMGVDLKNCIFVQGDVSNTLKSNPLPKEIALLRLDTDWFESTKIELEVLFPRLVSGGILIIDDYGHWEGARKAVDEYFAALELKPLFIPLDYSGRICVKIV